MDSQASDSGKISPDLFSDSSQEASPKNVVNKSWIGTPLRDMYPQNDVFKWTPPPIKPSSDHIVLFSMPIPDSGPPKPRKTNESYCWDREHVRMPFSTKNLYPAQDDKGETILKNRWTLIKEALSKPINSSQDLEDRILSYNNKYGGKFIALHHYFNTLDDEANTYFFENIMPKIVSLALKLPELLPSSVPLLKRGTSKTISLTQMQIASLLANAFLCTFPRRNTTKAQAEYSTYPDINFNRFFQAYERNDETFFEKMKCLVNYFRRIIIKPPEGVVTFQRIFLRGCELPQWGKSNLPLSSLQLHIDDTGTIDENGLGFLQVDFANKYIGGGVLGMGCVQEEIRFMVCTELIVTRLFTEVLGPTESLIIVGVEQYNKSRGYADSFEWVSNYDDNTPKDEFRRTKCYLVAIDALYFHRQSDQYRMGNILRELNKAYVGYFAPRQNGAAVPAVATGNWGCGAFRGDPNLKSLLQLMACRMASRDMVYYTFGDKGLKNRFYDLFMTIVQHNGTIGDVYQYLKEFCELNLPGKQLYEFLHKKLIYKNTQSPPIIAVPKRLKLSDTPPEPNSPNVVLDDIVFSDNDSEFTEVVVQKPTPNKSILLEKLQKMDAAKAAEKMDVDTSGKSDESRDNSEKKVKRKISDYFKK